MSFGSAPLNSSLRNRLFDSNMSMSVVNKWFANVSRVVIDPRYRGAGLGSKLLRKCCKVFCRENNVRYLTAKTSMGAVNKFNERAGFDYVGKSEQLGRQNTKVFDSASEKKVYDDASDIRVVYEYFMDANEELGLDIN